MHPELGDIGSMPSHSSGCTHNHFIFEPQNTTLHPCSYKCQVLLLISIQNEKSNKHYVLMELHISNRKNEYESIK